jgi:hypothetical protein
MLTAHSPADILVDEIAVQPLAEEVLLLCLGPELLVSQNMHTIKGISH